MKLVKKIAITILLIFICIGSYFICSGYQMYKKAINKMPLKDKITTIRQKEDYTKIDDMPQIYLKAVVSVEDHRFYKHFGIDVISIGRAFVNDIKKLIKEKIYLVVNEESSEMIKGLLLGDKTGIEEEIQENFKITNLSHILAVSGMHVSYIILGLSYMLNFSLGKNKARYIIK